MNNKIYVGAFIIGIIVGLMVFMAIMIVYLKVTTNRIENKINRINATLDQWELTK